MEPSAQLTVTRLLHDLQAGRQHAVDELFAIVYDELHALAHRQRLGWQGDYTVNTTALVHETYLKLVNQDQVSVDSRAHFFALAGRAMRHLLSKYARDRRRLKRGGDRPKVSLHDVHLDRLTQHVTLTEERAEVLVLLDQALGRLEQVSSRQSRVVECRFYAGMTVAETAAALGTSPATVKRDWAVAQAWLYDSLQPYLAS